MTPDSIRLPSIIHWGFAVSVDDQPHHE